MKYLRTLHNGAIINYPTVANTVSIMGSLGPEAVRKQNERGLIWAYCFDIILYQGKSLTDSTQAARRRFLANQLENVPPHLGLLLMPTFTNLTIDEIEELFYLITDPTDTTDGGEGLILKDPQQKYNAASNWYKLKRSWAVDVVFTGNSIEGTYGKTGQMEGKAASLEIGVYHEDQLVPVGWISAIRNGMHNLQTPEEHANTWAGVAIECSHNGLQKNDKCSLGYTLRHPRFRRLRDDKTPTDCTWDHLFEDANKKLN
jgi:ATP-dependent DNA ligase